MSNTVHASETCGCGASCAASSSYGSVVRDQLSDWRKNHRHTEPAPTPLATELVSDPQPCVVQHIGCPTCAQNSRAVLDAD